MPAEDKELLPFEKLVSRYIPGRMAFDIINYFIIHGVSVAELKDVVKDLGAKKKVVAKMMAELEGRAVLKKMGTGVYNYAPTSEIDKRIRDFINEMRNHNSRAKLTALLLAADH